MKLFLSVPLGLLVLCPVVVLADEQQTRTSPSGVVQTFWKDPTTEPSTLFYNPPDDPEIAAQLSSFRNTRGPTIELLFEIRKEKAAVVGTGFRSEGFRHGIDIAPMFLIEDGGWKILFAEGEDEMKELLQTLPQDTAAQIRNLWSQFNKKSDEAYASAAKQRALPLEIDTDSLQGTWCELENDRVTVVNLMTKSRYAMGCIANGRLHDRVVGSWAVDDGQLVLTDDDGGAVRRYVIAEVSEGNLLIKSEEDPPSNLKLSKVSDTLLTLFPALALPAGESAP